MKVGDSLGFKCAAYIKKLPAPVSDGLFPVKDVIWKFETSNYVLH